MYPVSTGAARVAQSGRVCVEPRSGSIRRHEGLTWAPELLVETRDRETNLCE